jgi:hypothetical protein
MKQQFKAIISVILVFTIGQANAQIKVFPQNKVLVGPNFGVTSVTEQFAVRGDAYFIQSPALSGLSIKNQLHSSSSVNLTGIIPQWNSSVLLGTDDLRFHEVHTNTLYLSGIFFNSDEKLKSNIQKIASKSALEMVLKLNAYTYDFTAANYINAHKDMLPMLLQGGKNQIGFMAQEVQQVVPQLVQQNQQGGGLSINYVQLIPILLESIKEQQAQIEELKKQVAALSK